MSRTATRVAMPMVPSEPTKQPRRSKPGVSGSRPPSRAVSPSGSTTSTASTCALVTPGGQAVRAAGVGGDVPADRAGLLRGRIGRVVQAEVVHRAGQVEVQHAGLDPRDPADRIDLEHAVHLRRDDDDRVAEGRRAAGEAGAAPPRHERPAVPPRDAHRGRDRVGRLRPAHRERVALRDAGVARVQRELERFGARAFGADRVAKIVERARLAIASSDVIAAAYRAGSVSLAG